MSPLTRCDSPALTLATDILQDSQQSTQTSPQPARPSRFNLPHHVDKFVNQRLRDVARSTASSAQPNYMGLCPIVLNPPAHSPYPVERPSTQGSPHKPLAEGSHPRRHIPWPGKSIKHTVIPKTLYERSSPLHSKSVDPLDYDVIMSLAKSTHLESKMLELLRWNVSLDLYSKFERENPDTAQKYRLPLEHIQQLIRDDNVEEVEPSETIRYGSLFTVYEEAKHRQRAILWPRWLNEHCGYNADFTLPSVREQLSSAGVATWACCFDLTASFFQAELAPNVRNYFCFIGPDGKHYRFKRMCMGFAPAPEIMDCILRVVVADVIRQFPDVHASTYIDNVRFMHDDPQVLTECAATFKATCKACRITLNDEPLNAPHQSGIFLGVYYDYARGLSALTDKTRSKLLAARLAIFSAEATISDVLRGFGLLFFASSVLEFPLASMYHAFKYYRRKAVQLNRGTISEDSPAQLWACIRTSLASWFDTFDDATKTNPVKLQTSGNVSLYTDASLSGAGAVLFTDSGEVLTWSRKFTPLESSRRIEELEAIAASEAFTFFGPQMKDKSITMYIDNTSVLGAVRKGHSPSFNLNKHISALASDTRARLVRLEYVRSAENPADYESRLHDTRASLTRKPALERQNELFPTTSSC